MRPGDVISERYRLLRLLDVGGMGEVWAARNELTQRSFAIKFLLPALAERADAFERFIREAETAGSLDHPSIVDVFDVAQSEDGRPFIVMELLSGESVEARVERAGVLSSLEAAAFFCQVADGLEVAHRAGIVHRDLSAANVFLARNPEGGRAIPKILDFGVSKTLGPTPSDRTQTGHGAVLGCPEFMSPEQARGAELVDARTDVWSLGVVLYQCLAGVGPFRAKNYNALMVAILTRPHRPLLEVAPSVDPELAAVVEGCLVKDREQRIQSARDVADRLGAIARRLSAGTGVVDAPRRRATDRLPAGADGGPEPGARSPLRHRLLVGAVCAIAGVVVGASVATLVAEGRDAVAPRPVAGSRSTAVPASDAPPARPDDVLDRRAVEPAAVARAPAGRVTGDGRR